MAFTRKEKLILKLLVDKEISALQKEGRKLFISNSPFLTKVAYDAPDVIFLKSKALYQAFLENLRKKLGQKKWQKHR